MFIKQVTIQGFRSYREQTTVDPFSPNCNVIVGRNGSGKSNFFYAIQFVLSDEFSHLKSEQRQSLLHEGSGPRVISAYVEIIFDNTDNRLPIEKDEVVLQRVIGAKKDTYFLDKKTVTKQDVMNLLESAGFSRSNPYYIVKQGKINELATAPDSYRLKLLREVAGTRVYDERKEESNTILKDTEAKREKIQDLLKYIEERLKTLEEEKEELKEYQKWDKMKRSLEYTIYDQDLKETRKKLDEIAEKRENSTVQSHRLHDQLQDANENISKCQRHLRELEHKVSTLEDERSGLCSEESELFKQKAKLELMITDLRQDVDGERSSRKRAGEDLKQIQNVIAQHQNRLEDITPRYQTTLKKEQDFNQRLALAELRKKELYAKTGRKDRFKSKEERDEFLRKQLKTIQRQIGEKQAQIKSLEDELKRDERKFEELEARQSEVNNELEAQRESQEQLHGQVSELRRRRDNLYEEKKELFRQETILSQDISALKSEYLEAEQSLKAMTGKGIMQGIDSVHRILEHFEEKGINRDVLDGYHGTLIELLSCEPSFYTCVEVTAGNKLFYHIVDNDRIGTKILSEMNRMKFPGEVNFIPLNRIECRQPEYPQLSNAVPMVSNIKYEEKYSRAFVHVFGKTLICRNMDTATTLARQCGLDCITLEGDQVSHKGALTGGFYDSRKSRLQLQRSKYELHRRVRESEEGLEQHKEKIAGIDGSLNNAVSELQKADAKLGKMKDLREKLISDRLIIKEELNQLERSRQPKERQLNDLKASLAQLIASKNGMERELGTELQSQLNSDEQDEMRSLNEDIDRFTQECKLAFDERIQLEKEKTKIESILDTNLFRKRDELQAKLQEISIEEQKQQLDTCLSELTVAQKRIQEISKRMATVSEELELCYAQKRELDQSLEQWQNEQREVDAKIAEDSKEAEKLASKQRNLLQKKEECSRKIRELGSLPSDAFDRYQNLSTKQLFKKLDQCNHELKKYSNVNKKAMDQFVSFSEQKEKLGKRKEELDRGHASIVDLMNALDHKKHEAISLTFKQVSRYFSEVFQKLVPQGSGQLVMKKGDTTDSQDARGPLHLMEQFTGVGIKVSFTGKGETREMQQLSGGQKSLVALAMIFAIQRCDPAPFYLFDEIDAALDAQHRKAVADMISELSKDAQFIITTFRPELLDKADKFYGVRFRNKVSHIDCVTSEEARDFVEDDATHG